MRIVGSESPSLPPLHPLPPSEKSWALQVESEDAAHLHSKEKLFHRDHVGHCSDHGKQRSWGFADRGSREASHESRDAEINANVKLSKSPDQASYTTPSTRSTFAIKSCDDSWRQASSLRHNARRQAFSAAQRKYCAHGKIRSSDFLEAGRKNENKISPPRSHRSHHCQSRAFLYGTAIYTDAKVSDMANRSCHASSQSSDNAHSRQSQRERHQDTQAARFSDNTDIARHGRTQNVQLSAGEKGDMRHGCHRRTRDVKLADNARLTKPLQHADIERHDCLEWHNRRSSSDEAFRGSKQNVYGEFENENYLGIDEFKLEARSYFDNCKQSTDEGCTQTAGIQTGSCIDKFANGELKKSYQVSILTDEKCWSYEENEDHGTDVRNGTCKKRISQSEIKTKLASQLSKEAGALLMQQGLNKRTGHEGFDTNLLQAEESISNTLKEGQRDNLQEICSFSDMLEMSCRDDAAAKEDDFINTEQQYKMLASLLLDDSLDIGQEFDITLAPGGPDLGFCGSIFDDDFEIPDNMDVEDVAHIKDTASAKKEEPVPNSQLVDLREPHLCVMRSLFQDGKNVMKPKSVSSNKLVEEPAVLRGTGFQPAEKQRPSQSSLETKPSPKVFVDVTNKFEIHMPPVAEGRQENDTHRLNQRQKQVEFGKNTLGYERYCELVPRCKRKPQDPQTPNPKQICSKRSWDGQIRKWRRLLHVYDLPNVDGEERAEDFSILKSRQGDAVASKQDNTRFSKSIEIKGCNVSEVKKTKEDASLTIYDDWIVS